MPRRGRPSRATVYHRLEIAAVELRERLGGLPSPKEAEPIWLDIWHEEAHHSTAIEGNTLALREVTELLEEGRAIGAKALREYAEVKGYAAAARWVYSQALDPGGWTGGSIITLTEVRQIHTMAMGLAWEVDPPEQAGPNEGPGSFRRHEIRAFPAGMKPPPWPDVPALLSDWVREVNSRAKRWRVRQFADEPFPEQLARIHNEFERVHPFLDGNGRAGRLALNLVLVRLSYPPVIILKRQRQAYLSAMENADRGEYGPLGELIARAMLDNLNRFIVPNTAGPAQLVPLAVLASEEFSVAALRQAAERGRLDAVQGLDGLWRSSRRAVEKYRRTKHQRRPT